MKDAGHVEEGISPSEKLGFGFICYIIYSDVLCFSKGKSLYTLITLYKRHQLPFQKQMGRLHSQSSAIGIYPGTLALSDPLPLLVLFTLGYWGYSWEVTATAFEKNRKQ